MWSTYLHEVFARRLLAHRVKRMRKGTGIACLASTLSEEFTRHMLCIWHTTQNALFHTVRLLDLLLFEALGGLRAISKSAGPAPRLALRSTPFPKGVVPGTGTALSPLAPRPLRGRFCPGIVCDGC